MSAETDEWVIVAGGVEVNRLRGDGAIPIAKSGETIYKASELPIGTLPIQPTEYTPEHDAILSCGYFDIPTGIKLKARFEDQTRYGLAVTMSNEAILQGRMNNETPQSIWDYSDVEHSMTTIQMKELILRYGFWCRTMFNLYA